MRQGKELQRRENKMRVVLFLIAFVFAQDSLPLFVPQKPEKPLTFCSAQKEWLAAAEGFEDWEEIKGIKNLEIRMPYATFDNFTGHNLYCGIQRTFLHKDAMQKLKWATALLKKEKPNYKFILFDAARANHAQEMLRSAVRNTPWQHFVSSPSKGSIHAYGMAVDIGLLNENGELVDMGLPYDSFAFYAGEKGEAQAILQGLLTDAQIKNRAFLRSIMRQSGWISLPSEWWHFNAAPGDTIRAKYAQPLPLPQ
jgi:D-alanyl-D-alanine dipeptidase